MGNRAIKGIAVAGPILIEKTADPQCEGMQKLSCTGCVADIAGMLKGYLACLPISAVGRVGADAEGRFILRNFQNAGIATGGIRIIDEEPTGFLVDTAYQGAARNFGVADVVFRNISCSLLHLGHFLKLDKIDDGDGKRILKHAKQCGMQTSISVLGGSSQRYGAVQAVLPYTDYLIVRLEDGANLANMAPDAENIEKIARRMLWHGVRKKVFILSDSWLACCTRTQYALLGNYILPEESCCTEEQAYHAFCAGVLTGIAKGWPELKILEFASSCVAVKRCTEEDAGNIRQTEEFCKNFRRNKKVL